VFFRGLFFELRLSLSWLSLGIGLMESLEVEFSLEKEPVWVGKGFGEVTSLGSPRSEVGIGSGWCLGLEGRWVFFVHD